MIPKGVPAGGAVQIKCMRRVGVLMTSLGRNCRQITLLYEEIVLKHELVNFMQQLQQTLAFEYGRIRARVTEDPGTAGDDGEECWAALLREWIPSSYPVVTKGRIISLEGVASPQIDIIVLHPSYPRHLLNKKHYIAGGVVAAFECKLTIKAHHIEKAFETAHIVKTLSERRLGSPYKELQQPIFYGLLAHSHSWKGSTADIALGLLKKIHDRQFNGPQHPAELMDLICIADLGNYSLYKHINIGPNFLDLDESDENQSGTASDESLEKLNHIVTAYECTWANNDPKFPAHGGTILGAFLSKFISKLAYEDPSIRSIAEYYTATLEEGGIGLTTVWYPDILSAEVLSSLRKTGPINDRWGEWVADI